MRILVVDDQREVGLVVTCLAADSGHETCLAADGCTALKLAEENTPEIVLLDIHMPGIDGYETARRLRNRCGDRFPIFALTADPVDFSRASQCGIDGIFAKPFSATKLDALIAQLSRGQRDGRAF